MITDESKHKGGLKSKKAGPFLILPFLIEYINLSDFVPINIGSLRRQGNNEDRFSAPLQY